MSEGAADAEAGTADVDTSAEGSGTDAEDAEAGELLDGMQETDLASELERWKAESRKWEGRSKRNSDAAARLKEIEQANMTELQKAQAMAADAEERAATAMAMHNRVMAAAAHSLPVDIIEDLGTGTEEEINERAERFARVINDGIQAGIQEFIAGNPGRNGQGVSGARPVESMRPGSAPSSSDTPTTPDGWFRALLSER